MSPTIPPPPRVRRALKWGTRLVAVILVVLVLFRFLLGFETVLARAEALPLGEVSQGFPYEAWDAYLDAITHEGGVRYEVAQREQRRLRRVVATFESVGPRSQPARFPSEASKLAYYINAYNALTLLGVVDHAPIRSVHDVRGLIDPRPGFGFFYAQRFRVDGRHLNLYNLEHDVLRPFGDARVHAAINCASASCPRLASEAYRPESLEAQLDAATREFCSTPPHVRVDAHAHRVELSPIFEWFAEDFQTHAARLSPAREGTLGFIEAFATAEVAAALAEARAQRYEVHFVDYDWSLNARP